MLLHAKSLEGKEHESAVLVDVITDRRIHEHLSNPNDVITEEDIRNIVTSILNQPARPADARVRDAE